jgi:hypothetical protein
MCADTEGAFCSGCGSEVQNGSAFCGSCGRPLNAVGPEGADATQGGTGRTGWREVARAAKNAAVVAREAAAPYVERAAAARGRTDSPDAPGPDVSMPPNSGLAKESATVTSKPDAVTSPPAEYAQPAKPGISEKAGRSVGAFAGYAARGMVGTASKPVVDTIWTNRPNLPTWQKVVGVVTWPLMVLTPHGWVFLAASFLVMVLLGNSNPYQWAVWVTKASSWFLLVTVVIGAIVLAVAAASDDSSTAMLAPVSLAWLRDGLLPL